VPHLTHLWHTMSPKPDQFWLDYDLHWLRHCDCVLRLPGESSGADKEEQVALGMALRIFGGKDAFQLARVGRPPDRALDRLPDEGATTMSSPTLTLDELLAEVERVHGNQPQGVSMRELCAATSATPRSG
jgi:hypothetical protein